MKQTFSPSEAALSVFELAKRQPQFVLRFCILYALLFIVIYAIGGATGVGKAFQDYTALMATGKQPDPERVLAAFAPATTGIGIILLTNVLLGAALTAMGLRKAVRDEDTGFFGLQAGRDEGQLLIAMVLFGVILFGVNIGISLVGGLLTMGNAVLLPLVVLASVVALVFVGIRLSQYGVLTIANDKVAIQQSWDETKGQFWRFFGAHLLWVVIGIVLSLIVSSVGTIGALAMGAKIGGGMPPSLAEFLTPGWLLYTLLSGLVSGFVGLGYICVGAYAWHQMRGNIRGAERNF